VRRFAVTAVLVALGVSVLGACGDDDPRVYVFGDSLVNQGSPYIKETLENRGFDAKIDSLAGTATCDWFQNIERARENYEPDVVVMSFSGNALGPCMLHPDGSALSNEEYLAKYRADTERAIAAFGDETPMYLVGAPVSRAGDDRVFRIYQALVDEFDNVRFVDGGKYVTPDHKFAATLPCLRGERCTGPTVNGVQHNEVRAPDGAHFCPSERGPGRRCAVYSSGAFRFARAIAEAVEEGEG
jgi:hypothetical protein